MRSLTKKRNYKSEEHFHDEWAKSAPIETIDIFAQFEGITSPEYKEAIALLGNVKGKNVLNLGCGLGEEATYLAILGAKVVAIDMSKEMLKATKKLAQKYNIDKNISYFSMSAEKLEFKKDSFDAVLGCNILHHVNIGKTILQIKKILKHNGIAVFCEPLAYNPLINIYRIMAYKVRTDHEHPLNYNDLKKIKTLFPNMIHKEFHLSTLLIFVWFFLGERLHPNKVRYWKKIIVEAEKYKTAFKVFYSIDCVILKLFPFLRKYCWVTLLRMQK
jgi:2-polyprenyl-3-methyl-5-hydroxy-6-metoxy-1,4-benzoquinol methylase